MPIFGNKLRRRQSTVEKPSQPEPPPVSYELPPINDSRPGDLAMFAAGSDQPRKGSAASITSVASGASKAPVKTTYAHFHKPVRLQQSLNQYEQDLSGFGEPYGRESIASLYSREHYARSMERVSLRQSSHASPAPPLPRTPSLNISKRHRVPQTFNLAVIGPRDTGKTSFLRSLVSRCELAHSADVVAGEQDRKRLQQFGTTRSGRVKPTGVTDSLSLDILDVRGERLALTCVDAPGWEADNLGEMKAEMVVNNFLRSCELRFAGSLDQENQVVRTSSKPDQHIHVVLYFVDPASFSWSFVSGAFKSRQNAKRHSMKRSRSASMSSTNTKRTVKESPTGMDLPDDVEELLTSSLDLRLMKKLSKRASVLPVIAKADTLTKQQLRDVKAALDRDMRREGLDYGVLEPVNSDTPVQSPRERGEPPPFPIPDLPTTEISSQSNEQETLGVHKSSSSSAELQISPATPLRRSRSRTQSLSRRRRTIFNDPEVVPPPTPSTANLAQHLPFSMIAPESLPTTQNSPLVREYPWGSINVMNPEHCDFGLVFQTLINHHIREFRAATKTLYEAYRTQQLIERRLSQAPEAGSNGA